MVKSVNMRIVKKELKKNYKKFNMIQFKATSLQLKDGKWLSRGEVVDIIKADRWTWWTLENIEQKFDTEGEADKAFFDFCLKQGWKKSK